MYFMVNKFELVQGCPCKVRLKLNKFKHVVGLPYREAGTEAEGGRVLCSEVQGPMYHG